MDNTQHLPGAAIDQLLGHIEHGDGQSFEGMSPEHARAVLGHVRHAKAVQASRTVAKQAALARRRTAYKAARVARRASRKHKP